MPSRSCAGAVAASPSCSFFSADDDGACLTLLLAHYQVLFSFFFFLFPSFLYRVGCLSSSGGSSVCFSLDGKKKKLMNHYIFFWRGFCRPIHSFFFLMIRNQTTKIQSNNVSYNSNGEIGCGNVHKIRRNQVFFSLGIGCKKRIYKDVIR